jgi:hypothetical protein
LTDAIPGAARGQIGHALSDYVAEGSGSHFGYGINVTDWMVLNDQLRWVLTRAWGVATLPHDDVRNILAKASDAEVLDVIEAWYPAIQRVVDAVDASSGVYYTTGSPNKHAAEVAGARFRARINDVFDERDVAWQLVGERIVPRSSAAMHATVVEPVFALTNGEPRLAAVEKSYQDALRELKPGGDPSDAITDAARALQEMLTAAGARGNALGPLLADAHKRELLAPYDSKLADAIDALGDWVSADRSARGDAHHVGEANRDDAWLAVRVAGALILRLAAARRR